MGVGGLSFAGGIWPELLVVLFSSLPSNVETDERLDVYVRKIKIASRKNRLIDKEKSNLVNL